MNDLIERQAAIDALRTCYDTETVTMDNGDEYINYDDAVGEIEELPSAQPMRKKGEWLECSVFDEPQGKRIEQWQSAKCSVCGKYRTTPYLYYFDWFNWCPNCGADMRPKRGVNV